MSHGRSSLPLVLALFAIAIVGGLFATGVINFGTSGSSDDPALQDDASLLEGTSPADDESDERDEGTMLASMYGEGDLGAVKLRLLWLSNKEPLADQPVQLISRIGKEMAVVNSDADGVVQLGQIPPSAHYTLRIAGEGFALVMIRGVEVAVAETNDLGNIMLGTRVVLRGRVISESGKALPNTAVSVHEIRRNMIQQGFLYVMASEATSVPIPVESVKSDDDGFFTFAMLHDGSYRLVARQGGYASKHESDVLVDETQSERIITIVLGPGATARGTVKTEDGKAIAGAQVIAIRDYGRRMQGRLRVEREVTTTDESGHYVLDTLAVGGSYRFGVMAEGFPTLYDQRGVDIERNLQKDFVLPKGGTISGTVLSKGSGEPVANAQVAVALGQMGRGQGSAQLAETDALGRFAFASLLPGPVMSFSVKAKGYITSTRSMWTNNGLPKIEPEGEQDLTIEMEAGGQIEGQVRDSAGTPITGAVVSVMSSNMGMMFTGTPSAVTIEDGSYTLTGLPKGKYTVTAQAEGFANAESDQEVDVPEGSTVRARNIDLTEAGRATGVVNTPDGEPLAGARVRARGREPQQEGGSGRGRGRGRGGWMRRMAQALNSPVAVTDEKGRFTLKGLAPKMEWVINASHDAYVDTPSEGFRVQAGDLHETEIVMQVGASISGIVTDENGERAANVRIRVGTLDAEVARRKFVNSWEADRSLRPEVIVTDSEGKFRADNLEAGIIALRAEKDGYVDFYRRNIRVKPGQQYNDYRVRLSTGETVTGTVTGPDGQPVSNCWVGLDTRANPSFGRRGGGEEDMAAEGESGGDTVMPRIAGQTDAQGKITIERVPPGTYSALVWFAPGFKSFRDGSEAAIKRDFQVPGATIEFRLEVSTQQPGGGRNNR